MFFFSPVHCYRVRGEGEGGLAGGKGGGWELLSLETVVE